MADNVAALKAALKAAFNSGVGVDDNADQIADDISQAIRAYALALKATGADTPTGDSHNLSLG